MAEDHLQTLKSARNALVEVRRRLAEVLAKPYERGKTTEEILVRFTEVQRAIEAVDSALKDEQNLAPSPRSVRRSTKKD